VGWQKKHVCGCEGMVAGKGSHTLAFVGWIFLVFFFVFMQQKFLYHYVVCLSFYNER
jgi:asparagine N-glycosylation enzyme membrane subunit Stt3